MKRKITKGMPRFFAPVMFLLTAVMQYVLQKSMLSGIPDLRFHGKIVYFMPIAKQEAINEAWEIIHIAEQYANICGLLFITSLLIAVLWNRKHKVLTVAKPAVCIAAILNVVFFTTLFIHVASWHYINFPPIIYY